MEAAAVQRPLVLVGHSISGLYLRSYAAHYPADLAGLVFVDGSTPGQEHRLPMELTKMLEDMRRKMPLQKLLTAVGWFRLQGACTSIPPGLEADSAWIKADSCILSQANVWENEFDAWRVSGEETIHAGPFGSLPVMILSHDPAKPDPSLSAPLAKSFNTVWNQMQEEEKGLSSQSRRIIAKGSGHFIQDDRSDLMIQEFTSFVAMIRNHQSFPNNQSTTEE